MPSKHPCRAFRAYLRWMQDLLRPSHTIMSVYGGTAEVTRRLECQKIQIINNQWERALFDLQIKCSILFWKRLPGTCHVLVWTGRNLKAYVDDNDNLILFRVHWYTAEHDSVPLPQNVYSFYQNNSMNGSWGGSLNDVISTDSVIACFSNLKTNQKLSVMVMV